MIDVFFSSDWTTQDMIMFWGIIALALLWPFTLMAIVVVTALAMVVTALTGAAVGGAVYLIYYLLRFLHIFDAVTFLYLKMTKRW